MTWRFASFEGYAVAFSLTGLVLYVLQLLPNIVWIAVPPANDVLKHNNSPHAAVNLIEQLWTDSRCAGDGTPGRLHRRDSPPSPIAGSGRIVRAGWWSPAN